jgi:YD repeat-containing protein
MKTPAGQIVTAAAGAPSGTVALGTYTFDNNGDMSVVVESGGATSMAYDKENRLIGHRLESVQATYLYDGDGKKRVEINENGITTLVWDGEDYLQARFTPNANAAEIVWVDFPASVTHSSVTAITVAVTNVGTSNWTGQYAIGSQAPAGNSTWGVASVSIEGAGVVAPGSTYTFSFNLTAPASAGIYPLQWRMSHLGAYFGQISALMQVQVV